MASSPADYARVPVMTMNMAGRFTGREIKPFAQKVLRHLLIEKQVGLFLGQQISFKPTLPEGYGFVGSNKAFICYNKHLLKVNDERQYRHFLRDLHLRGHLPHSYLPEKNYVVMKMRYRNRPWSEFLALSWVTDERLTKVQSLTHIRKVLYYASHLAEAEEMPVIVGATFRIPLDDISREMNYDFSCYGYTPTSARRKLRHSNVFLCAEPMLVDGVKPLICSKMEFEMEKSAKALNPEDAFYWDPVLAEIMLPIETPESLEAAECSCSEDRNNSSQMRPITGISSKHLLVSASTALSARNLSLNLPTAPVLPTPQEHPPSPTPPDELEEAYCGYQEVIGLSNSTSHLEAIDEVSSEIERQDAFVSSDTETIKSVGTHSTSDSEQSGHYVLDPAESEKEEKMFEILESMMNDKNSSFYHGKLSGKHAKDLDPALASLLKHRQLSVEEEEPVRDDIVLKKSAELIEACSSDVTSPKEETVDDPDGSLQKTTTTPTLDDRKLNGHNGPLPYQRMTASMPSLSSSKVSELPKEQIRRAPSCHEMYDEELVETSSTCYVS